MHAKQSCDPTDLGRRAVVAVLDGVQGSPRGLLGCLTHTLRRLSAKDGRSAFMDDRQLTSAFSYSMRQYRRLANVDELGQVLDTLKTRMSPNTSSPSSGG